MPTYDYRCSLTGEVFEVRHSMSETLSTWGEVCERTGWEPGTVPVETPVERLATGGQVVRSSALKNPVPPCASGGCSGGGMCGMR